MIVGELPKTARAAVLRDYGEPLTIEELTVPPPDPGALVVEVDTATVCGTDVHVWQGRLEGVQPIERPLVLGHEVVGRVAAIGDRAELDSIGNPLALGDRVVWAPEPCGHCRQCTVQNDPAMCANRKVGMLESCARHPFITGGFAEYSWVWPRSGRLRVPDDVKSEWASAASCALRTVINGFERLGRIDEGHTVVIQGSGPLGLFGTAIAATRGPRTIVVVGAPDERLELAREWGAEEVVSVEELPEPEQRIEAVRALTDGGGDVVIELSGAPTAFAEGLEMAAPNARYCIVGTVGGAAQPVVAHRVTTRQLTIFGAFSGDIDSYFKAMEFMRLNRDRFDWDRLVGNRYGLDRITEAVERMSSLAEIKPIVTPNQDN